MKVNYLCRTLVMVFGLTIWFFSFVSASGSINWRSYEEGMVLGKIEKKKVFLHFYADWCFFCAKMAKDTFQDSAVVSYLNDNFIAIRVDFDKEQETAARYGVPGLPYTMFLTEMGEPITSLPGYIPPDALLPFLKEINGIESSG